MNLEPLLPVFLLYFCRQQETKLVGIRGGSGSQLEPIAAVACSGVSGVAAGSRIHSKMNRLLGLFSWLSF